MRTIPRVCSALALGLALAACGSGGEDAKRAEPPPVKDTAYGNAVDAMEKARSVQDTAMQRKDTLDQAIDANEGSGEH